MSAFSYNGVELDVVETVEFSRTPKHDALNNYLYTTVRVRVRGILNEDATNYVLQNIAAGVHVGAAVNFNLLAQNPGEPTFPATTAQAIRQILDQPRRQLVYTDGSIDLVRSPDRDVDVDSANGPVVMEGLTVVEVMGSSTFHIEIGVETYINEDKSRDTVAALISHTWEMQEHINVDQKSERRISGRAVFSAERLARLRVPNAGNRNVIPDDFRSYIIHPVPDNFRRESIKVTATEDNLGAMYEVVDVAQYVRLVGDAITRIEGFHTVQFSRVSTDTSDTAQQRALIQFSRSIYDRLGNLFAGGGSIVGTILATAMRGASILAAGAVDAAMIASDTLLKILPRYIHTVEVHVYGTMYATHGRLSDAAHRVASSRLSRPGAGINSALYAEEITETRDLHEPHVMVRMTYTGGFAANLVTATNAVRFRNGQQRFNFNFLPDVPEPDLDAHWPAAMIDGELTQLIVAPGIDDLVQRRSGQGQDFFRANGTRTEGNNIGSVVAASLRNPGQSPPRPTRPPIGVDAV